MVEKSRIFHLKIQTGDKVKGMTVACEEPITQAEMLLSAQIKFGSERVISVTAK